MSDSRARGFLEDILAHPDDDTPRLIFADWLEEAGDSARAEFIRVQIERASLPEWDARQVRLRLRERELSVQHGQKWFEELPKIKGVSWEDSVTWGDIHRRGFVAMALFSSFSVLRKKARACWAVAPIETVSVRETSGTSTPIAGLRELCIGDNQYVDPREFGRLADSPLLSKLRVLNIRNCTLGAEGFRRLVTSPHLGNLMALRVPDNNIGNEGISALFDAGSLTSLVELDLTERGYSRYGQDPILHAAGIERLAVWPGLTRLRSLTLSGNDVGRDGLRALLRSPRASGLKKLALRATRLDGQAMQEFGAARPELQLDILDLGENLLRDLGAAYLADASCLRELKVLDLDSCEMSLSAARRLAKAPFLGSLRQLNVNNNSFGSKGLHVLLEQKPAALHTLQIVHNGLDDKGVAKLAKSPASGTLLELNLAFNGLGDHAAQALAKAKHLRNLVVLDLASNPLSKPVADALAGSPLGKRLAVLVTQVSGDFDYF